MSKDLSVFEVNLAFTLALAVQFWILDASLATASTIYATAMILQISIVAYHNYTTDG